MAEAIAQYFASTLDFCHNILFLDLQGVHVIADKNTITISNTILQLRPSLTRSQKLAQPDGKGHDLQKLFYPYL
jgi:hypothetical protein